MKKSFPFVPVETQGGTVFRPILVAKIEYRGKTRVVDFLVDSGADFSLLSHEYAKELGMDFSDGEKRVVKGICRHHGIECVKKKILLDVAGFDKPVESSIYVSEDLQLVHNLLGRDNIFIQYRVGFDQKEKTLLLEDRS